MSDTTEADLALNSAASPGGELAEVSALVGSRLTMAAFRQLCGRLAGYPFVKVVVERKTGTIHFLNHSVYAFHGVYIGETFWGIDRSELEADIDRYNEGFYHAPDREYFLGILSLHKRKGQAFFALETVEIDNMDAPMACEFFQQVRAWVAPSFPIYFKPANHLQETFVAELSSAKLPRIFGHELFSTSDYIPLQPGVAEGRLRSFTDEASYQKARETLEWYDIIVMHRVPDDIPRLSGILNANHTTPLSHTNVLATGWGVPNCIQIGVFDRIRSQGLEGQWVRYRVEADGKEAELEVIERPSHIDQKPAWKSTRISLEAPETTRTPIVPLEELRMADRYRYGTKAANLGELKNLVERGSERLLGFYRVRRPPRKNLLPQLAKLLKVPADADLQAAANSYLQDLIEVPEGIAIPFSFQREFLESSPQIQQAIGKLKMALELEARQVDSICISLQRLILKTRIPDKIRNYIDSKVAETLAGVSSFVVRSSSNAEDLENFSAAGIYESINHVTKAETLFESIKRVWASLLSPRSVRLRQEVGIPLEDCYMGVIIQEEVPSTMGGVLVTANPMKRDDFRNVYLNASNESVEHVVQGTELPYQYLFNIIEGGGRTLSLGEGQEDLDPVKKEQLQKLAIVGRLLQSHFSPDYTFQSPVDIEWLADAHKVYILQLRPYAQ